jgi:hypothetical protein
MDRRGEWERRNEECEGGCMVANLTNKPLNDCVTLLDDQDCDLSSDSESEIEIQPENES